MEGQKKDTVSKSWFCVFNNPEEHGYNGTPVEIVERLREEWTSGSPTRTGAWLYCISAEGLKHVHMVLEDEKAMRFSAIKKGYAVGMHFAPTKGTKEQAEDYIRKRGKFEEKGEQIIAQTQHGEIKGAQGKRRDLEVLEELIELGYTPTQIYDLNIRYRNHANIVKSHYVRKRDKETPIMRDVTCYWHVGASGSGKSYNMKKIIEERGEDSLYLISDYENGCFDNYEAQQVLFLDEYRGQWKYSFLLTVLDRYKRQFHARFANIVGLWTEVHITSVKTPDMVYHALITDESEREIETFEQLKRRINFIVYHWKVDDNYYEYSMPMIEYKGYEDLVRRACSSQFYKLPQGVDTPFEG